MHRPARIATHALSSAGRSMPLERSSLPTTRRAAGVMSEPLCATHVYRNLRFRSSFFGLTPIDLPIVLVPGGIALLVSMIGRWSSLWGVTTSSAVALALVALKWRKREDYIERLLLMAFAPRRLSHKERDRVPMPFPLDARLRPRRASLSSQELHPSRLSGRSA